MGPHYEYIRSLLQETSHQFADSGDEHAVRQLQTAPRSVRGAAQSPLSKGRSARSSGRHRQPVDPGSGTAATGFSRGTVPAYLGGSNPAEQTIGAAESLRAELDELAGRDRRA